MIERIPLMNGWRFSPAWRDGMEQGTSATSPGGAGAAGTAGHDVFTEVSLPHSPVELPLNYFDETAYQAVSCYRKTLPPVNLSGGRRAAIRFEGVMAVARVWLNGTFLGEHRGGYTPFEFFAESLLRGDGTDEITVSADARERPDVPPFGGQIDYLTYSGIYREVSLDIYAPLCVRNAKIECPDPLAPVKELSARFFASNTGPAREAVAEVTLSDRAGKRLAAATARVLVASGDSEFTVTLRSIAGAELWTPDAPVLYTVSCALSTESFADVYRTAWGFRSAEFRADGFYLNGKPFQIVGLNRHQAWPYVGYAMPARAQRKDADILKDELRVNTVRTSHYPQSIHFLDRCDERGLLVFEEIPGWQHLGGDEWKDIACRNVREMIERDWNHPSIVIWGVRINESLDDDAFYAKTNAIARSLDATRATGGVRYIQNSSLLEDVYTMNDFVLDGGPVALRNQREVTGLDRDVPYLVTEYNGHMYPTKKTDCEERQSEHVIRHLRVQNDAFADAHISGAIGWCAFDYNTHKDFGAGDRICHHGVMDIFRIPKFASFAYASQTPPERGVVLKPVTWWARGERSVGGILPLVVLTNCEEIGIKFGEFEEIRVAEKEASLSALPYPPFVVNLRHIPLEKIGAWGMRWEDALVTGYIGGKPAATVRLAANPVPAALSAVADDAELASGAKDATRVTVAVTDRFGNPLPFADTVARVSLSGPARIQGPSTFALTGGSRAFWVESSGAAGTVTVTVATDGLEPVNLKIAVV